MQTTVRF